MDPASPLGQIIKSANASGFGLPDIVHGFSLALPGCCWLKSSFRVTIAILAGKNFLHGLRSISPRALDSTTSSPQKKATKLALRNFFLFPCLQWPPSAASHSPSNCCFHRGARRRQAVVQSSDLSDFFCLFSVFDAAAIVIRPQYYLRFVLAYGNL